MLSIPHGQLTADTVQQVAKPDRAFFIRSVRYHNATGLAEDASNFFDLQVRIGTTVVANHSTETGEEGSITADTWTDLVIVDANKVGDADDTINLNFDETGTATLPAGTFCIELEYL